MFNKILVVCAGNICRSPIAEQLLKEALPQKHIASAGIVAAQSRLVGKPADQSAQKVALAHGVDISGHTASQVTPKLCKAYDLILVMEPKHIESITDFDPSARGKTMLLSHFSQDDEIPDPYRLNDEVFNVTFKRIQRAVQAWSSKL